MQVLGQQRAGPHVLNAQLGLSPAPRKALCWYLPLLAHSLLGGLHALPQVPLPLHPWQGCRAAAGGGAAHGPRAHAVHTAHGQCKQVHRGVATPREAQE